MEAAKHEKPPVIILNVIVVEAKGLVAKDVDGRSYYLFYCRKYTVHC